MPRKKSETIHTQMRMKELLRSKLERAAKANGVSMNMEINRRLEESFAKEDAAEIQSLAAMIALLQNFRGAEWRDDTRTCELTIGLAVAFFQRLGPKGVDVEKVMRNRVEFANFIDGIYRSFQIEIPEE